MNAFYMEVATGVLRIICALIGVVLTAVITPWVKTCAIPWMKDKQLYGLVQKFVQAAEKLSETGVLSNKDKKDYVVKLLTKKGYKVDAEIEAFIESAVKELDMTVDNGFVEVFNAFEEKTEGTEEVAE